MTALLAVEGLSKRFRRGEASIAAADGVSFEVGAGETLALVGPSGSGKSTIARLILRLIEPDAGAVRFDGADWLALSPAGLRHARRHMQIVFQNPDAALNPRATVRAIIEAPLRVQNMAGGVDRARRADAAMERVGLASNLASHRPHELSGGQKQRVAIARAIAPEPKLIVLDEATSALDATVRAGIVALLMDLQRERRLAYLLIAHDLALVRSVAHRVAVLDHGRIVEQGPVGDVLAAPRSSTSRALIDAALPLPFE